MPLFCQSLLPEGNQPRNSEDAWLAQDPLFEWQHNTVFKKR